MITQSENQFGGVEKNTWLISINGLADADNVLNIKGRARQVVSAGTLSEAGNVLNCHSTSLQRMILLYDKGLTVSEIAERINRSRHYVQYELSNAGVVDKNPVGGRRGVEKFVKKRVLMLSKQGEIVREFESVNQASELTGVNKTSISKACLGKRKIKGKYGRFVWRYKD